MGARRELIALLRDREIDVLFVHGYKAGLIGWLAARRVKIPVVAVSRGWTGECRKVRVYEWLDRKMLRRMDAVVCVSQSQAAKVKLRGVEGARIHVIPNAIDADRFTLVDAAGREELRAMFRSPPRWIVGAAGRLSPEKGFDVLVDAAGQVVEANPEAGFVLFGDGPQRETLSKRIRAAGLEGRFVLAGHRTDFDRFLPHFDLFVQSSFTEGMPNVLLEAMAARVPVVATAVGGTVELIEDDVTGRLVPPGRERARLRNPKLDCS